ncbi:septum site-determining protein MinC [Alteribacillus bidgolensis]|uniref:Probable septum site-determining protein MinC n=1 Tax=Alteribacillus bidgolensis TaxID=930129 RepID=A0A1G8MQV5_9BACI|nr:septum site-determining protein MinC [Alteribacillus bidgolensis]SDI70246.1 septum site-determining protein MinC [Alteribacillus bidgolensis]
MAQAPEVKQMSTGPAKNLVTIKGTKEGLTVILDDQCSFDDLTKELKEKISNDKQVFGDGPEVEVKVDAGYRYLLNHQKEKIKNLLEDAEPILVGEFHSEVISKEEARREREETGLTAVTRIIRSGQILRIRGDVLLLGDVNPGGIVEATGNVYILGTLKGIARAGVEGSKTSVVCASVMAPHQISISDAIFYAPNRYEKKQSGPLFGEPVYAYIANEDLEISFEKTRLLNQFQSAAAANQGETLST